jgi:hypothetical protein
MSAEKHFFRRLQTRYVGVLLLWIVCWLASWGGWGSWLVITAGHGLLSVDWLIDARKESESTSDACANQVGWLVSLRRMVTKCLVNTIEALKSERRKHFRRLQSR